MDEILVHAVDLETFNIRLKAVLQRCQECDLRLNPDKTKVGLSEVTELSEVTKLLIRVQGYLQ